MDKWRDFPKKLVEVLKKYKFAVLILLLGIALLLIPSGEKEKTEASVQVESSLSDEEYAGQMEARIQQMLSQIQGAGQVQVMLTLQRGSRTEYQTDLQLSENEENKQYSEERKTVILSEGSAYDKPAVSAVEYPEFLGALIICQGAEKAEVKLSIVQAVSALTGLSSDRITVVKMK